jgi:hypothetical protein
MLTGTTTLVAKIYPEKIVKDLVGRSVKEFGTIMGTHSEIVEVNATSKPFWLFSFPDSAQKITVLEKSPF